MALYGQLVREENFPRNSEAHFQTTFARTFCLKAVFMAFFHHILDFSVTAHPAHR
jgi:hypothetical protein